MNLKRPQILISNDDGIHALGIMALAEVAMAFGDVTIVAPNSPQSAMGHAISLGKPLRLHKEMLANGIFGYSCNGTPADCVKLATGVLMETSPDIILSGINHGTNTSVSSIYSGTLSAAREGAIQNIPAIGFSLCNHNEEADVSAASEIARLVIEQALHQPLGAGQLLSVNIPPIPLADIKGIKVTRQAMGRWVEQFDERKDPYGKTYYWLKGTFKLEDLGEDTDEFAIRNGYVSVTPMTHDLTHKELLVHISKWNFA
jgi:5'-nucleotidase